MRKLLKVICVILIVAVTSVNIGAAAAGTYDIDKTVSDAAEYVYKTVPKPQVSAVGGEWAVVGLARSGADIPKEYYKGYYNTLAQYTAECGGVLHERKYTEYSRVIIALAAIGKSPADVGGYNILSALTDFDSVTYQGLNGAVWALIALNCAGGDLSGELATLREKYKNYISGAQLSDGGWSLSGNKINAVSDAEVTAMALQSLAPYRDEEAVSAAVDKGLSYMSTVQTETGGFIGRDGESAEAGAQMLIALSELEISIEDERFVKGGNTILDNMMSYYTEGGFKHIYTEAAPNLMATEQCLCALAAAERYIGGKNSLYSMDDSESWDITDGIETGLTGKNQDVSVCGIVSPGKTFADIADSDSRYAIEALAERGIINGKTDDSFEPDSTITRAEFAAIVTRGLGLPQKDGFMFSDVADSDWFFDPVNTAYSYGIVKGVSDTEFNPNGSITREEAAVMTARAASLCGISADIDTFGARNVLAGFTDYVKVSDWALASLAFCYSKGILPDDSMEIRPQASAVRCEVAQMLFNTLNTAKLLEE